MSYGLKDSILGTLKVLQLDKENTGSDQSGMPHGSTTINEPMTVLAQRRADRMKPRPQKEDKYVFERVKEAKGPLYVWEFSETQMSRTSMKLQNC